MTNKEAIAYIESLMSHYEASTIHDKHDPTYRYAGMWISAQDMIALKMGIEALKKSDIEDVVPRQLIFDFRDKLNKWMFYNCESVCGNNMIDIDYLDGHMFELLDELGVIKYDEEGHRIDE